MPGFVEEKQVQSDLGYYEQDSKICTKTCLFPSCLSLADITNWSQHLFLPSGFNFRFLRKNVPDFPPGGQELVQVSRPIQKPGFANTQPARQQNPLFCFSNGVLLCISAWLGTHCADQADLKLGSNPLTSISWVLESQASVAIYLTKIHFNINISASSVTGIAATG